MPSVSSAIVPIETTAAVTVGELRILVRPRSVSAGGLPPLVDLRDDVARDASLAPVQLLEGEEYLYELSMPGGPTAVQWSPAELFDPDGPDGVRGRLRPGLYTGTIAVDVRMGEREIGCLRLEVRSRKLGYLDDYRWMLSAIANDAAEALMLRFSPSQLQQFAPAPGQDARTLYQRFAFLQSLIKGGGLSTALHEVLRRPHHRFVREEERRSPSRGIKGSASLIRHLLAPGPRVPWPSHPRHLPLSVLPRTVPSYVTSPDLDTEANRFIKFALEHWRGTIVRLGAALEAARTRQLTHRDAAGEPIARGLREVGATVDFLDSILAEPLFRRIAPLRTFPVANQVLARREGYREIFRAFLASEVAAQLRWDGGEDVYGAGQRDVATLYELWVFLELARIVARCCDPTTPLDRSTLFAVSGDGVAFNLKRGRRCLLKGERVREGRRLLIELWFNREFARGESWSRVMRPDCSLRIAADPGYRGEPIEVWLHFDAKYRVERLSEVLGADHEVGPCAGEQGPMPPDASTARRDDLLKMHAYRDAIHRSAGAYVLYPGAEDIAQPMFVERPEYHEILPGVGAFVLRPVESGEASPQGAMALHRFIDDVLAHVANQASRRERAEFWREESYAPRSDQVAVPRVEAAPLLTHPPADTPVLLGYVKNASHLQWILRERTYNLRGDDRTGAVSVDSEALAAPFVALYGPDAEAVVLWRRGREARIVGREELEARAYPDPGGQHYLCIDLEERLVVPGRLTAAAILDVITRTAPGAPRGAPVVCSWVTLFGYSANSEPGRSRNEVV